MSKVPGPIKAIKGGIQGVKNANMAVKMNNQMAKNPQTKMLSGTPLKKQTMGPLNAAKAFVNGAKNPGGAKAMGQQLKSFNNASKNATNQNANKPGMKK